MRPFPARPLSVSRPGPVARSGAGTVASERPRALSSSTWPPARPRAWYVLPVDRLRPPAREAPENAAEPLVDCSSTRTSRGASSTPSSVPL